MKAKKRILILALCGAITFSMVGCSLADQNATNTEQDKQGVQVSGNKDTSNIDEYETVGEIIQFNENEVHILTGDIAEIFKIDKDSMKDFYLGETVGVKKIEEGKYELEKYKVDNFEVRHTSMGELISTVSGKVKEIGKTKFTITTEDKDIEFESYNELHFEEGAKLTVDFIQRGEEYILINFYNENSKIDLTVKEIRRAENTGVMILDTEDNDGMKYEVYVLESTVINFNHSDLKDNDKITVYYEIIRESYPAQIDAKMIKR